MWIEADVFVNIIVISMLNGINECIRYNQVKKESIKYISHFLSFVISIALKSRSSSKGGLRFTLLKVDPIRIGSTLIVLFRANLTPGINKSDKSMTA